MGSALDVYLQGDIGDISLIDEPPLQSGYLALDRLLGGMQRSDLLIVGAPTGFGKSSLALNVCVNAAKNGHVCGIFSLEMSREQVAMRLLVAESGVDSHRLRLGLLSKQEESVIANAVGVLYGLPIYIDDAPSQTWTEMRSKAQRLKLEHGLDFLVVDNLDSVVGDGDGLRLKTFARGLEVPVLACASTIARCDGDPNRRPQFSDLKVEDAAEDADVVMFIYREDRNFTEEEWEQHAPGTPYPRNIAELIVAKHRHGPTGSLHLYFRDTPMRFDELMRYEESVA